MYIETYQRLISMLEERGMRFHCDQEHQSVAMDIRTGIATFRVLATVDEDSDLFQVFAYCPVGTPPGAIVAVCEAVARANFGLRVGKFEMDLDRGEIRFQASQILAAETEVTQLIINRMISTAVSMVDMYFPAFMSVIYANETPADAIRQVEIGHRPGPDPDSESSEPVEHES